MYMGHEEFIIDHYCYYIYVTSDSCNSWLELKKIEAKLTLGRVFYVQDTQFYLNILLQLVNLLSSTSLSCSFIFV